MRTRLFPLLLALLLVVGLAAGCGDDDDDGSDAAAGDASSEDVGAYCDAIAKIETVPEPDIDFETASEEEVTQGVKDYASDELLPLTDDVVEHAPDEIADEIDTLVQATEEVAETGNFEAAFGSDEVEAAEETAHGYDLENCGWGSADVTAAEYRFSGIDEELDEGLTSFDLTNQGKEMHELFLARKKDGVTKSFEEILSLEQEEAGEFVEMLGGVEPTAPGDEGYKVFDLEKGEYIAVCFLPTGATPQVFADVESGKAEPPEGPPHALQGMQVEFTVG